MKLRPASLSDGLCGCWKQPSPRQREAKRRFWILSEYGERGSGQAHVEQRPRTWIIKVSCVLITPSKRPGRSQEGRETLRMMRLISIFFFLQRNVLFAEIDVLGPVSNTNPHRLNQFVSLKSLCSLRQEKHSRQTSCSIDNQMFYLPQLKSDLFFFCIKIVEQQNRTIKLQLSLRG